MAKWFSKRVFEPKRVGEEIWGFTEDEFYPHLVYTGPFLPEAIIQRNDQWLGQNQDLLPEILKDMTFKDTLLLVRSSRHYGLLFWQIYHTQTDIVIGLGMLSLSDNHDYFDVVSATMAFEGFELYPNVLMTIAKEMGPLRSDVHLSPNANKVWSKLGAQRIGRRWVLNPK